MGGRIGAGRWSSVLRCGERCAGAATVAVGVGTCGVGAFAVETTITLTVDGEKRTATVDTRVTLLDLLREHWGEHPIAK